MVDNKTILYDEQDHIGIITLNRPEAMNSLNREAYAELEEVVRSSKARTLIITGNGRAFCAGDDVKQILGNPDSVRKAAQNPAAGLTPAADALLNTNIPIIAAVNGAAVGWVMELALMADIRVAAESAKFGELFVIRGLCCDAPGFADSLS